MSDKILIVDDDVFIYQLMKAVLERDHQIAYAPDGRSCMEAIAVENPQLVLLDIEMAGMNGYEVCREIKAKLGDDSPAVIFVSAHCRPEDRLAAYDVGATDFVTKPLSPEELYRKVEQTLKMRSEVAALKQSASDAMGVAMSAMSDTSALGIVIQFFRRMFTLGDAQALAKAILDSMNEYGLSAAVQIRQASGNVTLNSDGRTSAMENVLLTHLGAEGKRIVDYSNRTAFNYGAISVLIKNMPMDDSGLYGKLKDYLALLVEGASERLKSMETEALSKIVDRTKEILTLIDRGYKQQQADTFEAFNTMMRDFEDALLMLGLKESQENMLVQIVQGGTQAALDAYKRGLEIDKHLATLLNELHGGGR
ncbi:response regulator [Parachitinimonas caeni]|uniref:Response regulator n=1 Tax=Parachitinimonas caeni TaxID=3031301 RepID=A0ABT7DTN5_9NEIS|nr:response regulator [Parachitinimonas caeni]MDK2123418.1 response regulator [Parachitinimonas caeni]